MLNSVIQILVGAPESRPLRQMNWKRLPLTLASLLRLIRPSHSFLAIGSSSSSSRQPLPILRAGASATMSSEATATATAMTAYEELLKELDAIKQLSRVSSILGYDKVSES